MIDLRLDSVLIEANNIKGLNNHINKSSEDIKNVHSRVSSRVLSRRSISTRLYKVKNEISDIKNDINKLYTFLEYAVNRYENCENVIKRKLESEINAYDVGSAVVLGMKTQRKTHFWDKYKDEFQKEFDWSDLLAGSGYIGDIYDFIQDIKNGKTWNDYAKTGIDIYQFLNGAGITFSNYLKIGRAVGVPKAMTWWAKKITGIKSLGRASTARNPLTRFTNNLTNKTSPFNAQFKNVVGNFKGTNGVGKAVASWGAVAASGVLNWYGNKEEQANSNGTMSDSRVVAETITETAIDTVLAYGTGIVVGAAVAAASPVAVPGVLIVATTAVVITGLNVGVKSLTGQTTTEWASDFILNSGESVVNEVGSTVKNATNAVGKWFGKLRFC